MKKCDLDNKAFWTAVYRNKPETLKKLLASGMDPNSVFPLGPKSPFHGLIRPVIAAAQSGSVKNLEILMEYGADITGCNQYWTAIAQASYYNQPKIVEFLIEHGAEHNIFSHTACGDLEEVKEFIKNENEPETFTDEVGNCILHYAASTLQFKIIQLLLKENFDTNRKNNCFESAIHIVSNLRICDYDSQKDVLTILLEAGANTNDKDWNNVSALHKAVRARSVIAVELLVKYGADVNVVDNRGSTPLRRAVTNTGAGNTKGRLNEAFQIAQSLLEAGSDPLAKSKDGRTIMDAIRNAKMKDLVSQYI